MGKRQSTPSDRAVARARAESTRVDNVSVPVDARPNATQIRQNLAAAGGSAYVAPSRNQVLLSQASEIERAVQASKSGSVTLIHRYGEVRMAPKQPDRVVEDDLQQRYGVTSLEDVLNNTASSIYYGRVGTNRIGILMNALQSGVFNGQSLGDEQRQQIKAALTQEVQEAQASHRNATVRAIHRCLQKVAAMEASAARAASEPMLSSPAKTETHRAPATVPSKAVEPSQTSQPSAAAPEEPSAAAAPKAKRSENITSLLEKLPNKDSPVVGQILQAHEDNLSRVGKGSRDERERKDYFEGLTITRLNKVLANSEIQNFHAANFSPGKFNVEHQVTIPQGDSGRNISVVYVDPETGKSKNIVYHANSLPELGEGMALSAAEQGIKFERSSRYPSGYTARVTVTFTKPGVYLVDGKRVQVGEPSAESTSSGRAELTSTATVQQTPSDPVPAANQSPYQQFVIQKNNSGQMPSKIFVKMDNSLGLNIDLNSIQKGESVQVGDSGVQVCRLESGEVRVKCYKAGRLSLISQYQNGHQSPASYEITADPTRQAYYALQDQILAAAKAQDSVARFSQLTAAHETLQKLQGSLTPEQQKTVNEQFKAAFLKMWEDDLAKRDGPDFLDRLNKYHNSGVASNLLKLSKEDLNRLRFEAHLKSTPDEESPSNPFA